LGNCNGTITAGVAVLAYVHDSSANDLDIELSGFTRFASECAAGYNVLDEDLLVVLMTKPPQDAIEELRKRSKEYYRILGKPENVVKS
jgi:hypothetical protein